MNERYCNHDVSGKIAVHNGVCECGTVIRQFVYRYPARDPGTGDFAVWHVGASVVTVYGADGRELKVLPLSVPAMACATSAARTHGAVRLVTASTNLYPAGA